MDPRGGPTRPSPDSLRPRRCGWLLEDCGNERVFRPYTKGLRGIGLRSVSTRTGPSLERQRVGAQGACPRAQISRRKATYGHQFGISRRRGPVETPVEEPANTVEALVREFSDQGLLVAGAGLNPRPSGYEPTVRPCGVYSPADAPAGHQFDQRQTQGQSQSVSAIASRMPSATRVVPMKRSNHRFTAGRVRTPDSRSTATT